MQLELAPEHQARLEALAKQEGKDPAAVASELLVSGLEQRDRLAEKKREIGELLERRWEDYQSGHSVPVDGEQVFERLRRRSAAARRRLESTL